MSTIDTVIDSIRSLVSEKGHILLNAELQNKMHATMTRMKQAYHQLENEGYVINYIKDERDPHNIRAVKILSKPGTTYEEVLAVKDSLL
jgi:hypothetical protein